ncbi:Ldh family oxidoreductase [Thermodesulfobacteriota bacterium]
MKIERYRADDLLQFGTAVLNRIGYPEKQAAAAAKILVEGDLRGDPAHGIAGATSLDEIILKLHDDEAQLGFKRFEIADYTIDDPKYPTIISIDANGTLGHYVVSDILPRVIKTARQFGYAKAYIRNSTHFGDCGIYSDMIAEHDLAARVTSTAPAWMKPFIALQEGKDEDSTSNRKRYAGVKKRFGTNPIAWSIPYAGGVITIDMAATQRAVSPFVETAKFNSHVMGIFQDKNGVFQIPVGNRVKRLSDIHLQAARCSTEEEVKNLVGCEPGIRLKSVEKGLLKGPEGEDINYPLAFDDVMKKNVWAAPLGGTYFGYKGFGLNMLIELDNVIGGGASGLIRVLDEVGNTTTRERVSQTVEAYAIDVAWPLDESKKRLNEAVDTTIACGNKLMFLPGQKERESKSDCLENGVPMAPDRIDYLKRVAKDKRVGIPFDLQPISTTLS